MHKTDIRETTKQDLVALGSIVAETELFPPEILDGLVAPALAGSAHSVWLTAHTNGQVCGFCFAETEAMADRVWNMRALAVAPLLQGRGIGAALVAALEALLRKREQRLLLVDTSGTADFAKTRAFYHQNAYAREACIRNYWAEGDDKVTFSKLL